MKINTKHAIISSLFGLITISSLQAATIVGSTADAVWETSNNWLGGVIPGTVSGQADTVVVNGGRSLTLNSNASLGDGTIEQMFVGNQNPGAAVSRFTMTAGSNLDVTNFFVGVNGSPGDFTYNDGASLTASSIVVGRNNTDNGAPAGSTLNFTLGATGLSSSVSTTTLNLRQVEANHTIAVDASSYTGGVGDIDLISFTNHLGGDFGVSSVTGLAPGLAGVITYDADSVNLSITAIPEPSSSVLLGLGGLALLVRRKK